MHFRILLIAAVVSGCQVVPAPIIANQSCGLAPKVWRQIDTPSNREALAELPEQITKRPVRETFEATSSQREAWFEDSGGNLQACLYNPLKPMSCYGRELNLVVFMRHDASWLAGPTRQVVCVD
jgi:hypothetical protein